MKNKIYNTPKLVDSEKEVLRERFIALYAYINIRKKDLKPVI